jgi:isoleucyl-tRNA synthetase
MFDCMGKDSQNSDSKSEYSKREEDILKFWNKNEIFKKSENKGDGQFVFYDGPPFATGLPHYGHILAGTIKDVIPRYQVMKGNKIRRKWGWDCHGLPIEHLVEKELKIEGEFVDTLIFELILD